MMRALSTAVVMLIAVATPLAAALSPNFVEWGKGPVTHLMTNDEAKAWSKIRTDAEAEKFIALFWAKRDPNPATPQNEFAAEFQARANAAQNEFTGRRLQGWQTDRGKVLILFGKPTSVNRSGEGRANTFDQDAQVDSSQNRSTATEIWVYEKGTINTDREIEFVFIDPMGTGEYRLSRIPGFNTAKLIEAAQAAIIKSPGMKEPPAAQAVAVAQPRQVEAPAPVAEPTEIRDAALANAIAALRAGDSRSSGGAMLDWGEFITADGEQFVALQLAVPVSVANSGDELVFFGDVRKDGATVRAWEIPSPVRESKGDFVYVDRSISLPKGTYDVVVGVKGPSENRMVRREIVVQGLEPAVAGISRLLLSNNVFPLQEAQKVDDPFSFGGLKVVPKSDRKFSTKDELWYFIEARYPGVDEAGAPGFEMKVDVEGKVGERTVKMSSPAQKVPAQPLRGVDGHYALGSAIPLATFKPGTYTITIGLKDLVSGQTYNVSDTFEVVAAN